MIPEGETAKVLRLHKWPGVTPHVLCSCGSSFTVAVVSDQFEGKKLLDRHKLV